MFLGYKQKRAIDFLKKHGKPQYFSYKGQENKRIVDSLERKGLIEVFKYANSQDTVFVNLKANK